MLVERAIPSDHAAVVALDELVFGPPVRAEPLRSAIETGTCWVARDSGSVIAFAIFDRFLHGHGFLRVIAVHPSHRRKGVASGMMRRLEAACPTDRLFTATEDSNLTMQQLCKKLGFTQCGRISGLDDDHTELIYLKRLAKPPEKR